MRTSGDDIAEILALLGGVVPVWDEASRRITGLEVIPTAELGRPRIDVTVRISGFFRDAFPHVLDLLDDAVRRVAALDEPEEVNFVRANAQADLAAGGDERRGHHADLRVEAGVLRGRASCRWWRRGGIGARMPIWPRCTPPGGGFAYGRGMNGVPARETMENNYRRIQVAAKNIDTREHDIADSDDYYQYHGGMVAMVRSLTGQAPKAYVGGDSTTPGGGEDPHPGRGDHPGLPGPGGQPAVDRGDAPTRLQGRLRAGRDGGLPVRVRRDRRGVVPDWMYEQLAASYVLDETTQEFLRQANPWALRGIIEKLHEAAERELWEQPDPALLQQLQQVYLDVEGDLED